VDLLEQYKQQRPDAFQERKPAPADAHGREYGAMIRMAMRLSGGRIRDARQANYTLLVTAVVVGFVALLFFFGIPGSAPTHVNTINP